MDLLAPMGGEQRLRENYVHQLRQTINAYLPAFVFVGEALQNALDAARQAIESNAGDQRIDVTMDFMNRRVVVQDTGPGFPDAPNLLFLGGGLKKNLKLAGKVGVGLKVVLFSSSNFLLRSRRADGTTRVELLEACRFAEDDAPAIEIPDPNHLPDDQEPLVNVGTEISYTFPPGQDGVPERFLRDVLENCTSPSAPVDFRRSLTDAVARGAFPNRLAALISSELRRYSYLGATDSSPDLNRLTVNLHIISDEKSLGELSEFSDGIHDVKTEVRPSYFTVRDSLPWATPPKPVVVSNPLGDGGNALTKALSQFNVTTYTRNGDYEALLTNRRGLVSPEIDRFRKVLFPKIRSITLTIGRIPQFSRFLPGGPRRVISARGVITQHDIDVFTGQNQQYVRCFDMVIDVDADLNYGKTQLTDMHLVANVRRFVNEAYRSSIQNAARNLVGKLKTDDRTEEKFWSRPDLDVKELRQRKVPRDENDVIALLFELVGRGYFDDFDWYGLSSTDTYDSRAFYREEDSNHAAPQKETLTVVEFKLDGASIARDFNRSEDKEIARVDLVICYEIGDPPVDSYQVVNVDDSDIGRSDRKPYPWVTKVLYDTTGGREVQLLPLKNLLEQTFPSASPPALPEDVGDTE